MRSEAWHPCTDSNCLACFRQQVASSSSSNETQFLLFKIKDGENNGTHRISSLFSLHKARNSSWCVFPTLFPSLVAWTPRTQQTTAYQKGKGSEIQTFRLTQCETKLLAQFRDKGFQLKAGTDVLQYLLRWRNSAEISDGDQKSGVNLQTAPWRELCREIPLINRFLGVK